MLSDEAALRANTAISASDALLTRLESMVESLWARRQAELAATWAAVAARYGSLNHPGRFTSPRLERVLGEIGRQALPRRAPSSEAQGRIVHVLTEAYETGGHTRLVRRWIERDAGRCHDVILTRPPVLAVPQSLHAAVEASGGRLLTLPGGSLLEGAARLRAHTAGAEAVVLHVHMFDALPLLAFADRPDGPPVIFEDHADHLFWLGTGVADIVVSLRSVARELAVERRGIDSDRAMLLPIPVPPVERSMTRAEAKRALGLSEDTVVLLTVAVPFKYASVVTPSWLDATTPLLVKHRDWALLAVGPKDAGEWANAARRTQGRIKPLGILADISTHLHAADVYLDSYPFSSNTSLIEAASHGVPVVGFCPEPVTQAVLLSHDPGIEDLIPRGRTVEAYRQEVERLAGDRAAAERLGQEMRVGIETAHAGPAWTAGLEAVYRRAATAGRPSVLPPPREAKAPAEWELIARLLFASVRQDQPLEAIALSHGVTLPPELRADEGTSPSPAPGWDGVAIPAPTASATLRALDSLEAQAQRFALDRLALVLPPDEIAGLVPTIEGWLASRPTLDLEVLALTDPTPLVTFGRLLVLPDPHPLRSLASRNGTAVATVD